MEDATDTPLSDEEAMEMLLEPIETEEEAEADEAPQDETESDDVETDDDASEVEDDKDDEDEDEPDEGEDDSDDDDEEADGDDEQPATLHTVKVDGEEKQVTLEELQRGYSGQAYIQKGMEANKARERELEQHAQALQQQADITLRLYQQAQQTGFTPAPQEPDPALVSTDPIAYLEAEAAYKTQMRAYQAEQQQAQFLQQQQLRQHMQAQERKLLEEMPELKDPKKAEEFKGTLLRAKDAYGYSQDELREIVKDLRSVKALADAQKWRDLQAGKEASKQPREKPKAATRPKGKMRASSKVNFQKGLAKAVKSQRDEDFAALLLQPDI